jgi:hypothetical protein
VCLPCASFVGVIECLFEYHAYSQCGSDQPWTSLARKRPQAASPPASPRSFPTFDPTGTRATRLLAEGASRLEAR